MILNWKITFFIDTGGAILDFWSFWPENGRFRWTTLPVLFGHDSEYQPDRTYLELIYLSFLEFSQCLFQSVLNWASSFLVFRFYFRSRVFLNFDDLSSRNKSRRDLQEFISTRSARHNPGIQSLLPRNNERGTREVYIWRYVKYGITRIWPILSANLWTTQKFQHFNLK